MGILLPARLPQAAIKPLPIGAGGFVRGIDVALLDNTMLVRTDTYGGYVWDPVAPNPGNAGGAGVWRQIVTPTSMPAGDPITSLQYRESFISDQGCYEVRIAPSSPSIFYMAYLGYIYKSTNKGRTWTNLSAWSVVGRSDMASNAGGSEFGPKMAIDPINPNIVFIGLLANGCYKTLDGGSSWSKISKSGIPNPTASPNGILFCYDGRPSTQSGGVSQVLYAFSQGVGCFRSADGGASWTRISGSSTSLGTLLTCQQMAVDSLGQLWLTDNANGRGNNVWVFDGISAWTHLTAAAGWTGVMWTSITFDPNVANSQRVLLGDQQGLLLQSNNGISGPWSGGNGPPSGQGNLKATDIPWMGINPTERQSSGGVLFDNNSKVIWANGIGVFKATVPTSFSRRSPSFDWVSISAGIEQLVTNMIVSPPGFDPVAVCWDRSAFVVQDPTKFPLTYFPESFQSAPGGTSVDWASSSPSDIFVTRQGAKLDHYSSGSWSTNRVSIPSTGQGGWSVAASTPNNLLIAQCGGDLFYTLDGGASWHALASYFSTNFGVAAGGPGWCGFANYQNVQQICADRVLENTFYGYNSNSGAKGGGVYRTIDGGQTWTKQVANGAVGGLPDGNAQAGNPMLRTVPGKSGHLIYCSGHSFTGSHPAPNPVYISANGGAAWVDIDGNLRDVFAIGVGKQVGSYPRIVAWGWYKAAPGVFYSDDQGASWQKACDQMLYGTFDYPKWLEVDNNHAGRFYVGLQGSGFAYSP